MGYQRKYPSSIYIFLYIYLLSLILRWLFDLHEVANQYPKILFYDVPKGKFLEMEQCQKILKPFVAAGVPNGVP